MLVVWCFWCVVNLFSLYELFLKIIFILYCLFICVRFFLESLFKVVYCCVCVGLVFNLWNSLWFVLVRMLWV